MGYIGKQPAKVPLTSADIVDESIESADIKEGTIVNSDINAAAGIVTTKVTGAVTSITSHGLATSATTDTTNANNISSGTVGSARLGTGSADATKFLRGDGSWQVVAIPSLDSPVITGTLSVLPSGTVTHTIANWSDDISYTITPTNCTAGAVNGSGEFVITHTSGTPSYTILATTASLGLDDSALVTKNITLTLTAPTLSSPADVATATNVIYTITSTDSNDDKLILDPGTANFTYQSESGPGTASKVGNTVECVGFGTGNPVITIQFTAEATYSVTAKAVKIDGTYGTSANSSADSIIIANAYDLYYLVIAGGGCGSIGGGGEGQGGGGAGGYRTNYGGTAVGLTPGNTITVIIGDGGTDDTSLGVVAESGGLSSLIGTGISISSAGGGGASGYTSPNLAASAGGSGGGGGSYGGAGGAGNTPSTDPVQGYAGGAGYGEEGGGGGGSSAIGATASGNSGGNGGAGTANSISGASVSYAGGGGGGGQSGYSAGAGTGGTGGGGNGGFGAAGANATSYGSGGGGASNANIGGTGSDGIVIVRMADGDYSGTQSGGVASVNHLSSGDTTITFTGSGSFVS